MDFVEHISPDEPRNPPSDQEILTAVCRYIDGYGWSWNMARRLVNRYYGTRYTDAELKKLYRLNRNGDK